MEFTTTTATITISTTTFTTATTSTTIIIITTAATTTTHIGPLWRGGGPVKYVFGLTKNMKNIWKPPCKFLYNYDAFLAF